MFMTCNGLYFSDFNGDHSVCQNEFLFFSFMRHYRTLTEKGKKLKDKNQCESNWSIIQDI